MYFERTSFINSFQERVDLWDFDRLQRFLNKHELTLHSPNDINTHWDACREILLENMERLRVRIPEATIYDDKYMSRLFVVIYEKALNHATFQIDRKEESEKTQDQGREEIGEDQDDPEGNSQTEGSNQKTNGAGLFLFSLCVFGLSWNEPIVLDRY